MARIEPIRHRRGPEHVTSWPALLLAIAARSVLLVSVGLLLWAAAPAAWGWTPTTVSSDSMSPVIHAGDVVIAMPVHPTDVRLGQVLLVPDPDRPGQLRLHRFVGVADDGKLVLRGDANANNDSDPIDPAAVVGVGVIRVPWVGLPGLWVREGDTGPLAAGLVIVALLLWLARLPRTDKGRPVTSPRRGVLVGAAGVALLGVGGTLLPVAASYASFARTTEAPPSTLAALDAYPCLDPAPVDNPVLLYRFTENAGTTATDSSGNGMTGTILGAPVAVPGSCSLNDSPALTLAATDLVSTPRSFVGPDTFSIEIWFKTTTTTGGRLLGFGNSQSSPSTIDDRQLYMTDSGQIAFGVQQESMQTIFSSGSYNDGAWHEASATLSPSGMALYVDGRLVDTRSQVISAAAYTGWWRVGFDTLEGWTAQPTSAFAGTIDSAAVYDTALSARQVADHFAAGH